MSDRCEPPRVGTYYAKDGWVRKRSVRTSNPDGSTTHTLDFRVCRMSDEVGDEAAETVAALMNRGESADPAELAALRARVEALEKALRAFNLKTDALVSMQGDDLILRVPASAIRAAHDALEGRT